MILKILNSIVLFIYDLLHFFFCKTIQRANCCFQLFDAFLFLFQCLLGTFDIFLDLSYRTFEFADFNLLFSHILMLVLGLNYFIIFWFLIRTLTILLVIVVNIDKFFLKFGFFLWLGIFFLYQRLGWLHRLFGNLSFSFFFFLN